MQATKPVLHMLTATVLNFWVFFANGELKPILHCLETFHNPDYTIYVWIMKLYHRINFANCEFKNIFHCVGNYLLIAILKN